MRTKVTVPFEATYHNPTTLRQISSVDFSTASLRAVCFNVKFAPTGKDNLSFDINFVGAPSIRKFHVLRNRRHVITKDSQDKVTVWDVLKVPVKSSSTHFTITVFFFRTLV